MSFLIICRATTDVTELRRRTRRAHLEYIIEHRARIAFGGAMLSSDGTCMVGMLIALDVPDRELAMSFLRNEPYCRAGMFAEITVEPWAGRIPEPEAGFLQQELERERRLESAGARIP